MDATGADGYRRGVGIICCIGIARTGSSQLVRIMESFDGVVSMGELFHPQRPSQLSRLAAHTGLPVQDLGPDDAVEFVRSDPVRVLDALERHAVPGQWNSFKLFDTHLPTDRALTQVIRRPDVAPIFLRRRVIDTYASKIKARTLARWHTEDTTDLAIDGDIDEFVGWADRCQQWYVRCGEEVRARGCGQHVITYEDDIDVGDASSARRVAAVLRSAGVEVDGGSGPDSMTKQDRSTELDEKFRDWPRFAAQLRERDRLDLALGYFI